jgi:hypothetical protein
MGRATCLPLSLCDLNRTCSTSLSLSFPICKWRCCDGEIREQSLLHQ